MAVLHSLIAVETVLRSKISDAGRKSLHQLIERGAASGLLTARQAEFLHDGRKIRSGMAHGQSTHMVMSPAMAAGMVCTSFTIVTELCSVPAVPDTEAGPLPPKLDRYDATAELLPARIPTVDMGVRAEGA
ncbi:hypothetical protein ACFWBF_35185 [Streptomyces sp. NPDC060028]|uniref:hypothetical protein n=1 Tax=Streptomyces sp. NPDC060028 TaxID=3347041 RepID=UPI0036A9B5A1